ncbi:Alanine dehydrogenase [Aquicella siphonis]|uniref:Alanine dehydrogenase n=1 Tax=Aquicella siphonis TaxID=254247 RepID=A0A5E4PFV1_9COXI|nr:alanine dehydrogenase [Aquicella siphonis]VVC75799.1 Alanine dehydrogenase [Aquicella siphonis]
MLIGVPKEIKNFEYRVGLVPSSVRELIANGHQVIVQKGAGEKIGFDDESYQHVGARIVDAAEEIFQKADMVIKVKEPQPDECRMLRENQVLFTYLHLAPDPEQAKLLQDSGCVAIAYETVTNQHGGLPLLAPMSEVAGRMAIQAGATSLEIKNGGRGMLLGGVPGVAPAKVVVLGGGVVGTNSVRMAMGMGAHVVVIDKSLERLYHLDLQFGSKINTIFSTTDAIEEHVQSADLVIGAVLIPGASAPRLVTRAMLSQMRPGSVVVDVSIDQGGCFETSKPTTHQNPTYVVDGVVHYCVANMPGAVPRTSTVALNNATLPFALSLANYGYKEAMRRNHHLLNGLNVANGKITYQAVAEALKQSYTPAAKMIGE